MTISRVVSSQSPISILGDNDFHPGCLSI